MKKSIIIKLDIYLPQFLKYSRLLFLKNFIIVFFLSAFCLTNLKCKKNTVGPQLPPITQEGKITFGCKVNGKIWTPYWPCIDIVGGTAQIDYTIAPSSDTVSLPLIWVSLIGNFTDGESTFFIHQAPSLSDHLIYHEGNIIDSVSITYSISPFDIYQYYSDFGDRYFNITKLDTTNKIVAGVFAFTLYGFNQFGDNDSVVVTDGRFDFKIGSYATCSQ